MFGLMDRSLRAGRLATFVYFTLNGFLMGMWVVHIPVAEHRAGVGHAVLGWILLLLGAGAITMMLLSSYLAILSKAAGGRRQYMGPMGKADRMVLLIVGSVLGFFLPLEWVYKGILWIVLVGCLLTLIRRTQATYADLEPLAPGSAGHAGASGASGRATHAGASGASGQAGSVH